MHRPAIKISAISITDSLLDDIIQLWRGNSDTLGYMPRGGFEQAAIGRTLFGALDQSANLLGYVMFRQSRGGIKIAQLCVRPEARGLGLAKMLTEEISKAYPEASGIGLWCREDFEANIIWPRLGFCPRAKRRGRGSQGTQLILWYKDHANPDLFSDQVIGDRVEAVMDSCVYFDIVDNDGIPEGEESRALVSDWLEDSVRLLYSQEVRNDMHRDPNEMRKKNRTVQLGGFDELRVSPAMYDTALIAVKNALPSAMDAQTKTDYCHLGWTLACGVTYFLTRDAALLKHKELLQELGISILTPGEFIRRIDELERKEAYRPEEIAGAKVIFLKVNDSHISAVEKLADTISGESPKQLVKKVRSLIANPRQCQVRIAVDEDDEPLALIGEKFLDTHAPILSLVRFAKSNIAPTLARFIAYKLIHEKAADGGKTYKSVDLSIPDVFVDALIHCGFEENVGGELTRTCREGIMTESDAQKIWNPLLLSGAERETQIWPAKILDIEESVHMIPINPSYASSLFDLGLAGQTLFCDKPELLMQDECVYYSTTPNKFEVPGRIIWYVSQGKGYEGTSAARACSFLTEVVRGSAKNVYKQFKRFGVFDWKQIQSITDGGRKQLTAFRFTNTELFKRPIPLRDMLTDLKSPPAGPRPLSYDLFLKLYRIGMAI